MQRREKCAVNHAFSESGVDRFEVVYVQVDKHPTEDARRNRKIYRQKIGCVENLELLMLLAFRSASQVAQAPLVVLKTAYCDFVVDSTRMCTCVGGVLCHGLSGGRAPVSKATRHERAQEVSQVLRCKCNNAFVVTESDFETSVDDCCGRVLR